MVSPRVPMNHGHVYGFGADSAPMLRSRAGGSRSRSCDALAGSLPPLEAGGSVALAPMVTAGGGASGEYRRDLRSPFAAHAGAAGKRRGNVVHGSHKANLQLARQPVHSRGRRGLGGAPTLPLHDPGRPIRGHLVPSGAQHLERFLESCERIGRLDVGPWLRRGRLEFPRILEQFGRARIETVCDFHMARVLPRACAPHGAQYANAAGSSAIRETAIRGATHDSGMSRPPGRHDRGHRDRDARRAALQRNLDELVPLIERLGDGRPIDVRGAAMTSRLISDTGGPLYQEGDLRQSLRDARIALDRRSLGDRELVVSV